MKFYYYHYHYQTVKNKFPSEILGFKARYRLKFVFFYSGYTLREIKLIQPGLDKNVHILSCLDKGQRRL